MARIGFDIDGVLADFNSGFITKVVQVTGEDKFPPRPFDIPTWNYPEHYGYTKAQVSAVWEAIKVDPWFWYNLPAYPGARDVVNEVLTKGQHDVYFVTSRLGINVKAQTENWVLGLCSRPLLPTVLISSEKGLICKGLKLDFYIDDKRENCDDVRFNSETRVFIYDQPWNWNGQDAYTRIYELQSFLKALP